MLKIRAGYRLRILIAICLVAPAGCIAVPDNVRTELSPAEPAQNNFSPAPADQAPECGPQCMTENE